MPNMRIAQDTLPREILEMQDDMPSNYGGTLKIGYISDNLNDTLNRRNQLIESSENVPLETLQRRDNRRSDHIIR